METKAEAARRRAFWTAHKPAEPPAPALVPDPPLARYVAAALTTALLVQASLAPYVAFRGAAPPLVALLVGWYAVRTGMLRGLTFGLIAGACEDALAGTTGAAWTVAGGFAGLCAGRLAGTWPADTNLALVPGAALVTLLRYAVFALAMQAQGRPVALPLWHVHAVLWQSLEAAVLALVLLRLFPELGGSGAHRR